jgi:hypothetical protein
MFPTFPLDIRGNDQSGNEGIVPVLWDLLYGDGGIKIMVKMGSNSSDSHLLHPVGSRYVSVNFRCGYLHLETKICMCVPLDDPIFLVNLILFLCSISVFI